LALQNALQWKEKKKFERLIDWMQAGGAYTEKLDLRYYAENFRGVHAASDIKAGETILFVPFNLIFTLEAA